MAQTTARYRFEFRLRDWAERLATGLCGAPCGFFVGLREDGSLRRIYFEGPGSPLDGAGKQALAEAYTRWFLYAPQGDVAYLEWLGLDRATAERWLGKRLEPSDFLDTRQTGAREDWPESWRVWIG